jgi:hypothetical protein
MSRWQMPRAWAWRTTSTIMRNQWTAAQQATGRKMNIRSVVTAKRRMGWQATQGSLAVQHVAGSRQGGHVGAPPQPDPCSF